MPQLIAAIDQGTTSTRCMLFDHDANVVSSAQHEHRQIFPRPGWVEHDPNEIWDTTQRVVREAMERAAVDAGGIACVGITNQRETTVVWNPRTGETYHNAIVWQDTRTKEICDQLAAEGGQDRFRPATGLPLATYFSGPKVRWILENVTGVRAAAERSRAVCGTIDTWLIWHLTGGTNGGVLVTDVTNASRTQLMNLQSLDWDERILYELDIPKKMLPQIVPSSDASAFGKTLSDGPFGGAVPIGGALGDQHAAMLGQCCFDPGDAKNTYGTGCFLLVNTGSVAVRSTRGLLTTVAYQLGDSKPAYALEGSVAIAGALVQWLRDNLGVIERSDQIEDLAASVEDSAGIYFVPAFSGLFAPHWRADARGVLVGLTRLVNKGHIARAALEATCYQTREVLDAMRQEAGVTLMDLKVDGGMVVNELLMQFQADVLGQAVVRPRIAETTALGAAYAAGLTAGVWSDMSQLRTNWQADKTWQPRIDEATRQQLYDGWIKAVERSLDWVA